MYPTIYAVFSRSLVTKTFSANPLVNFSLWLPGTVWPAVHRRDTLATCRFCTLWLVLAAFCLPAGSPLFAADDTQTGANGTNGANGTDGDPGTAGADGGDGAPNPVTATAGSTSDPTNTATATGGNGGSGGSGGNGTGVNSSGGKGGNGANGAAAEATADVNVIASSLSASATANGGDGGAGGFGGLATGTGTAGLAGTFGNGGNAISNATATPVIGLSSGQGYAQSYTYGGDGANLDAIISFNASANAGHGGNAFATSLTTAPTLPGSFNATSSAQGGKGGDVVWGIFTGNGGNGGDATSQADVLSNATVIAGQDLEANAYAAGGNGGQGRGSGYSGGNGGAGTINFSTAMFHPTATTNTTNGHRASINVEQRGGNGGRGVGGADGGNGADSIVNNRVNAFYGTDDSPFANGIGLAQTARGGNGGDAETSGIVGNAGNAAATLVQSNNTPGAIGASNTAYGGDGGHGHYGANGGDGGTATAYTDVTALDTWLLNSHAVAYGGDGGGGNIGGRGGDATATAIGSTDLETTNTFAYAAGGYGTFDQRGGAAVARATSTGAEGEARSQADFLNSSDDDSVRLIYTSALAELPDFVVTEETGLPINTTSVAESRSNVGGAYLGPTAGLGMQAAAFATGLPTSADVALHVDGDTNVQTNFAFGPNTDVLGLVTLATAFAGDERDQYGSNVSSAYFLIAPTKLNDLGELRVGFLDPVGAIGATDSLTFKIFSGEDAFSSSGVPFYSATFYDTASALAFFDDQVLNLGSLIALDSEFNLRLHFQLESTADHPDTTFAANFLFGNVNPVPEPTSGMLLIFSAAGLLAVRRRQTAR